MKREMSAYEWFKASVKTTVKKPVAYTPKKVQKPVK